MSFRRRDFHGSRAYEADSPPSAWDQFGFRISLTIAWVKMQLDKLLQSGAPSSISGTSLIKGSRGYSLLGTDERDAPHPLRKGTLPRNDREPGFQVRPERVAAGGLRRRQSQAESQNHSG